MKKSKHTELIEIVKEIATIGRERGILHQYTEDDSYNGREITVGGQKLINYGSCSYLALETDKRIKNGAIDAVQRYGSQFACSRAYLSNTLYSEFEEHMQRMFEAPLLIAQTTSIGHQAVIPTIIEDNDALILDQQVHYSIQDVVYKLQVRGVTVTKIRHSQLDELENKIKELTIRHNRVWYFIDGIYSMYGDPAPLKKLEEMLNRIKQLHLYVDDAHGISWAGKYGRGYTLSQINLHPKMILATSLGKGFANVGGIFLFPNQELCWKVRSWGGLLSQSGPQPPAVIGACIATAKIHLSEEIHDRQAALAEKIQFCNRLLKEREVPLVSNSPAPIFFIGLGLPKVGYNMVARLMKDGLYTNIAVFPLVPETCTGLRFAVTLHHTNEDIERIVDRIAHHMPLALKEEGRSMEDIYTAFKSVKPPKQTTEKISHNNSPVPVSSGLRQEYKMQYETSIRKISKKLWNDIFDKLGEFNYDSLKLYEDVFKNNAKPEDNWKFHYYLLKDRANKVVAASFFTEALSKNDMLSSAAVSRQIEETRKKNPYFQTSRTMMMGSMITEGSHLYIDRSLSNWKEILAHFIDVISKEKANDGSDLFLLRDFDAEDIELRNFFLDQGFVKVHLPDTHYIYEANLKSREEFIQQMNKKKRKILKDEILQYERFFEVRITKHPSETTIESWYKLYEEVYEKSFELNVFKLPIKLLYAISANTNFEVIELVLKKETAPIPEDKTVAMCVIFKDGSRFYPMMLGMDYNFVTKYNVYKQMLFQLLQRANQLSKEIVSLGFGTSMVKKKIGAIPKEKVAYIQIKDDFDLSLLGIMPEAVKNK